MQLTPFFILLIPLMMSCGQKSAEPMALMSSGFTDTISTEVAVQHQENYQAFLDSLNVSNDSLGNNGWVSLNSLEQYISLSKTYAAENHFELSGFRIYHAKYPDENENEGKLTFFVSPTGLKADVQNQNNNGRENDPDILYAPLNYVNSGNPPNKVYPFNVE
ncbi:MAG: hypothetical protein IPM42_16795 [Saprospiraceae bacterium]|nr:hypothetical protein [Saprospiraceae bacterium]